jgi:hypothetical protein
MKIKMHVTSVSTTGDQLEVCAQGSAIGEAAWRSMDTFTAKIADTEPNRRAFRVGRQIDVTIKPKRTP